ncbi:Isopentenyl phosphate kinase-like protein [Drosera capensis]
MESKPENSTPTTTTHNKRLRCIVKIGGAAVTCKNDFERIDEENLRAIAVQLRRAMVLGEGVGMDWSRREGVEVDRFIDADEMGDRGVECREFVAVHGAGSFGHFQASKSGVHKGGLDLPLVKAGFVATRISVISLNHEIVRALAREGIPSIGMSPFSCGWSTTERKMISADVSAVTDTINSGFVPVLHGDAVLDHSQGCTILSGDLIIRHLAHIFRPEYVTDVFGVYDRPPSERDAILLREIAVDEEGSWTVVQPKLPNVKNQVKITVAAHDTTGGMVTKISEAAAIAKLGIDVYIVKAATDYAFKALNGEMMGKIPADWMGTAIRFSGSQS